MEDWDETAPRVATRDGGHAKAIRSSQGGPPQGVAFKLYVDIGGGSSEDVRAVLSALNDLDFAAGGLGLAFELGDEEPQDNSGPVAQS